MGRNLVNPTEQGGRAATCAPILAQEARILMNNKAEMTLEDLKEVLLENEVTNFDPVAEAFKVSLPL